MTTATYTVTENTATSVARQLVVGVRAKSGSSNPSKASDWKGGVFPSMTFNLAAGATTATATIETVGNSTVDGDRDFEFYTISQSPTGGTVTMSPQYAKITDDDTVQPIVVSPYLYSDDLESAAVGDDPMARANWSAIGAAPTTYKVSSNKGIYNTTYNRGTSLALFGPDLNTDGTDMGFIVEFDENKSASPGNGRTDTYNLNSMYLALFVKDISNYVRASTNDGTVPAIGRSYVDGADNFVSMTFRHRLQTPPPAMTGAASIKTRWIYHDGRMRVILPNGERCLAVDGSSSVPKDSALLNGIPGLADVASRHGRVGFQSATYTYDFGNGIRVTPLKMLVMAHARFASRTAVGSGKGRIWVGGDFIGTATRWGYRVMSASNGATPMTVVQDFREVTDVTIGAAKFKTFRYVAELPVGGPYIIETFMTDSDGVTSLVGSKRVTIGGTAGLTYGQSNSVKMGDSVNGKLSTFNRLVPSQPYLGNNTDGVPTYELTGMGTDEYTYSCNVECSRIIAEATGTPCLTLSTGIPGSGIAYLEQDSTMAATFQVSRDMIDGVIDYVIWDQGEGDRDGVDPPNSYFDKLESIYLKAISRTGNPNLLFVISPIGRFSSTNPPNGNTTWAKMDTYARLVKLAGDALVQKYPGKVIYGSSKLGILHGTNDPYHYFPEGYMETSRRCGRTIAKALGKSVPDGRGPIATGITRSGATITVAMDMNGAATLTDMIEKATVSDNQRGTPALSGALYGYEVSSDNFTSLLAISSIAPSSDRKSLVITLAADPGKPVSLRSYHGASYDDRYMFWGTGYANGYEDVPIWPILNYLTSAN